MSRRTLIRNLCTSWNGSTRQLTFGAQRRG